MHRFTRSLAIIVVCALVLTSACRQIPDHVRYIPKDAIMVAGLNLKSLSKKNCLDGYSRQ